MGDAGARSSSSVGQVADAVVDALAPLGPVRWKAMFGGAGIFVDDRMFGLVDSQARLFFKVGDGNRAQFDAAGSVQHSRMPYFSVPDGVLADVAALLDWARASAELTR